MVGNWINYFLFLAIIVAGYLFYDNYVMLVLIVTATALPVIFAILFKMSYKKLMVSIADVPSAVCRDSDVDFIIAVENHSFFPFGGIRIKLDIRNLFYDNKKEYIINIADVPMKKTNVKWGFKALYCGCVRININEIEILDILGLVRKTMPLSIEKTIEVYPIECDIELDIASVSSGESDEDEVQYRKGTDVSEISGIREYVPGDSLQSVHWKVSARYDDFMIKEYSMPYTDRLCLAAELYVNSDIRDELDCVLGLHYSAAYSFIRGGREFYIVWYNPETMSNEMRYIQNENDIIRAAGDMMYAKPVKIPGISLEALKNEYGNGNYTCVYITGASREEVVQGEKIGSYNDKAVAYIV